MAMMVTRSQTSRVPPINENNPPPKKGAENNLSLIKGPEANPRVDKELLFELQEHSFDEETQDNTWNDASMTEMIQYVNATRNTFDQYRKYVAKGKAPLENASNHKGDTDRTSHKADAQQRHVRNRKRANPQVQEQETLLRLKEDNSDDDDEDDMSSIFIPKIRDFPYPPDFKMPSGLSFYDGDSDPCDHHTGALYTKLARHPPKMVQDLMKIVERWTKREESAWKKLEAEKDKRQADEHKSKAMFKPGKVLKGKSDERNARWTPLNKSRTEILAIHK
ncbi:OLC1v1015667C1 [Oldenlandia corymbosa var. corymbosa]|uniref:OLC1v1015667C1 n=1 Tax=Oldenlandia corymbosa var. corymbosa TaxID=529605 RepID=A0AAV1E5Y3_OLDCO|nr:OLC1v1015667C1 [Oldenlandia corymbosa var. corymbosa]